MLDRIPDHSNDVIKKFRNWSHKKQATHIGTQSKVCRFTIVHDNLWYHTMHMVYVSGTLPCCQSSPKGANARNKFFFGFRFCGRLQESLHTSPIHSRWGLSHEKRLVSSSLSCSIHALVERLVCLESLSWKNKSINDNLCFNYFITLKHTKKKQPLFIQQITENLPWFW